MKKTLVLGVAIAALSIGLAALAYPTLNGPTGQAVIPTGNVGAPGITLAGDWQKLESGEGVPFRFLYAFGPSFEIGALYDPFGSSAQITDARFGGVQLDKAWAANVKFALTKFLGGDTAIGGQFRRETMIVPPGAVPPSARFDTDYTQGYLSWTDRMPYNYGPATNFALTLGTNWTQVAPPSSSGFGSANAFRGFGGLALTVSKDIAIEGDYQTGTGTLGDTKPIIAGTVRWGISPHMVLEAGTTNAEGLRGTNDQNIFLGLDFTAAVCALGSH